MAIFEIRIYPVKEGCMDEWVAFMENRIAPFVAAKGIEIIAMFRGIDDPNRYTWIRRFETEEERVALGKSVYDDEWMATIKPTVRRLIDVPNNQIHVMQSTAASPMS